MRAKAATYVGSGEFAAPSRTGSHDLRFREGELRYQDSYFGDADFLGQEVAHLGHTPIWGMNYYGFLLTPELLDAAGAGRLIKRALTQLYAEGRFLGGFSYQGDDLVYIDENNGTVDRFTGSERISTSDGTLCYRLHYHGGRIAG